MHIMTLIHCAFFVVLASPNNNMIVVHLLAQPTCVNHMYCDLDYSPSTRLPFAVDETHSVRTKQCSKEREKAIFSLANTNAIRSGSIVPTMKSTHHCIIFLLIIAWNRFKFGLKLNRVCNIFFVHLVGFSLCHICSNKFVKLTQIREASREHVRYQRFLTYTRVHASCISTRERWHFLHTHTQTHALTKNLRLTFTIFAARLAQQAHIAEAISLSRTPTPKIGRVDEHVVVAVTKLHIVLMFSRRCHLERKLYVTPSITYMLRFDDYLVFEFPTMTFRYCICAIKLMHPEKLCYTSFLTPSQRIDLGHDVNDLLSRLIYPVE